MSSSNSNNGGVGTPTGTGLNPINVTLTPSTMSPGQAILINNGQQQQQTSVSGTTTFILNPSPTSMNTHQTPSNHQHRPSLQTNVNTQIINTSQINQMIAASPLISQQSSQQFHTSQAVSQTTLVTNEMSTSAGTSNGCFVNTVSASSSSSLVPSGSPSPSSSCKSGSNLLVTNGNNNHENDSTRNNTKEKINQTGSSSHIGDSKTSIRMAPVVALDRQRLQELVQQVDPNEQLEEEVEDVLLSLADDFIESVLSQACMIAKHRKSSHLDVKDVQLALDINWNMWIPGFGVDGVVGVFSDISGGPAGQTSAAGAVMNRAPKKCLTTEAHKQRLALIKKVMKKF